MKKTNMRMLSVLMVVLLTLTMIPAAYAAEMEPAIGEILAEGCDAVNAVIDENGGYAYLESSDINETSWNLNVYVYDGTVTGRTVYEDIVQTLVEVMNKHSNEVYSLSPGYVGAEGTIIMNGSEITSSQIVQFVLALELEDGDHIFGPDSTLSVLDGQSFTAIVTTVGGKNYEWIVHFIAE